MRITSDEDTRRSPIQNVQFWGGLWGLLVTLSLGAQLWINSTPWRVIDFDFGGNSMLAIRLDPDETSRGADPLSHIDWNQEAERQYGTRLAIGSVVVGVIGIGLTTIGASGFPIWFVSRARLDRLSDKARTRWFLLCWVGVPALLGVWVVSNLIAAMS